MIRKNKVKLKVIIFILSLMFLFNGTIEHEKNENLQIYGSWFNCASSDLQIGDTLEYLADSCYNNGRQELVFSENEKFEYIVTGIVLQSRNYGIWKISNDTLIMKHNYYKSFSIEKFKIISLEDSLMELVLINKYDRYKTYKQ